MTVQRWIGSPAIAASLGAAIVVVVASCGQSSSSAKVPTPPVASSPTPVAPTPAGSPPPGGPVPAQLLGDWFLPEEAALALNPPATGGPPCPHPLSAVTCFARLTFTATTYRFYYGTTEVGPGEVVVNNNEIDFYNASVCSRQLPDGVGRYNWTLTGGLLSFALVGQDPCNRSNELTYQSWSRTH